MKKMMLIINPISGVNSKEGMDRKLGSYLSSIGYDVTSVFTERGGHATELAADAVREGFDAVTVCGGDGTINEAAKALCGTNVAMGLIPSGSGNGLARHLNIPIDEEWSLQVISKGLTMDCDCGLVNGQRFFCTFGLGFDAQVSHRFATEKHRGRVTYIKNIIEEYGNYAPKTYKIIADGKELERKAFLIACCNASQYGNNAFIAPDASVSDGILDIVIVKSGNIWQMLLAGMDVVTGMVQYNHQIEIIKASDIIIEQESESFAHIDGEPCEMPSRIEVKCLPKQLKIFVPSEQKSFTPFITPLDLTFRDWRIALGKIFR